MRFKDVQCVYCNNKFLQTDDVVVCPKCGSPHHRDCWKEKGECANSSRHNEGFVWELPQELRKSEIKPEENNPAQVIDGYRFKNGETAVKCPHCSAVNYGNDAVCMRCKKPLHNNVGTAPSQDNSYPVSDEQVFEYYNNFGGVRPETDIDGITAGEYAAYIGNNSGRFIRKFATAARFARRYSVSLCAFIFGHIWFFYRKLYKEGALFLAAMLLIAGLQGYCTLTEPMKEYLSTSADIIVGTYSQMTEGTEAYEEMYALMQEQLDDAAAVYEETVFTGTDKAKSTGSVILSYASVSMSLVMAFSADFLYRKKIRKDINDLKKENSSPEALLTALRNKGGVSAAGAVLGVVTSFAIFILEILPAFILIADKL